MKSSSSNFPLADYYSSVLPDSISTLHEPAESWATKACWSERHLQCIWFDPKMRPDTLQSIDHEMVTVADPGRWNLEAGPDFLDTVMLIGNPPRRLCGDTEIHIHPSDWDQHQHAPDPRYENVRFHITYHPGSLTSLPRNCIQISMRSALAANRSFSFADIDVSSYPHAAISPTPRPCRTSLANKPPEVWGEILEAAGQHRIKQKSDRISGRILDQIPPEQILYEELMTALGYKQNRRPFRKLSQLLTSAEWPANITRDELYALMLGTAGLLPTEMKTDDTEAQQFIRHLWDIWWKSGRDRHVMKSTEWMLSGSRPTNHPQRRLAAAAALFSATPQLLKQIEAIDASETPAAWVKTVKAIISRKSLMPYWEKRLSINGAATARPTALIGKGRISAIITNVIVPLRAAEGHDVKPLLKVLPKEDDNSAIRTTAARLLGRDVNPALYATGLKQQGLMQEST